ncbi:MAG: ABC transporter substrate-binding protein [Deltaproteobacteria bacterium]|nr:ABC transporter substrate-binding protein [Deltaproteobacteria bacterium]
METVWIGSHSGASLQSAIRNFKSAMLSRRLLFALSSLARRPAPCSLLHALSFVVALLLALCSSADAQQPAKVRRIGVLLSSSPSLSAARNEALRQGLRELGYVEGQNLTMEYRYAEGKLDRLSELAAELVRLNLDLIVVTGTRAAVAAKKSTTTIPIVIAGAGDPVRAGLIRSFTRPGGNVTGVSRISPDLTGKRLELLKETVPKASRMAALFNPDNPGHGPALKEIELGASARGMRLQPVGIKAPGGFESAFAAAAKERVDALFLMPDAFFHSYVTRIVQLAAKNRLPAMYDRADFVEAGGLMSYAVDLADLSRRAAWYVDQILQGASPADLPMVEPTKSELMINLKTAQGLGLTIPPNVLARADRVIK